MAVTRREVLERLAAQSDSETGETTRIDVLAEALDAEEVTVEGHLRRLAACELARIESDGRARVTITGEELLELDPGELIVVDPVPEP